MKTRKERVQIHLTPETAKALRIKAAERGGQSALSLTAEEFIRAGLNLPNLESEEKKTTCPNCGKVYSPVEEMVGQCNNCDPFADEDEMLEVFGEPEYLD
jgi:hypothetical protein